MSHWLARQVGKQLRSPSGWFGRMIGKVMNKTNREMYEGAYGVLGFESGDRVLEIGFGNGAFIREISDWIDPGFYAGIDLSETMLKEAQKRNKALIESGKVVLKLEDAAVLDFEEGAFNKVFTVNTLYFWSDPKVVLAAVLRVLAPGGQFVIAFVTRASMESSPYAQSGFTFYDSDQVKDLMLEAGFEQIGVTETVMKKETMGLASGRKPL